MDELFIEDEIDNGDGEDDPLYTLPVLPLELLGTDDGEENICLVTIFLAVLEDYIKL
jgi:hypothetical protein